MPRKPRPVTKTGRPRARKGVKLKPSELSPAELAIDSLADTDPKAAALADQIAKDGGRVLTAYREPLGGHVQLIAALPVDRVEPTPFQRDVSDAHVRKLTLAMDKTRRYLDPIIVVRAEKDGKYYTPNGNHRLTVMKELGAKTILGLVIPDERVAFQILSLNIEKAHNLREKALEVVRMYDELLQIAGGMTEQDFALEFEEPQLITLGFAYKERGRLSGGAYQPALKKVDSFLPGTLSEAFKERQKRAAKLLEFDEAVTQAVEKLKERGLTSPYLRTFVVARVNPLRFIGRASSSAQPRSSASPRSARLASSGEPPSFYDLLETMTKRARGMDPARIRTEDLARSGGAPEGE